MADNIMITAQCLCKKHKFTTDVPKSELSLKGNFCHCNSCRHSLGSLTWAGTTWPQPKQDVDISLLQRYAFSPNVTYHFCATCGSLIFCSTADSPSDLLVMSGVLDNINANLIEWTDHIFVEDTKDGGASVWLKHPNADGKEIPRYTARGKPENLLSWDWPGDSKAAHSGNAKKVVLPIWCHCKGVQLQLHPGDYGSLDRDKLPWYIDPRNNKRLASHDVCDSCRYQFGSDIINWTFALMTDITRTNGGAFPSDMWKLREAIDTKDPTVGTLAYYQSSPDVLRFFCGTCNACIFYAVEDRPEIADIAIGVLEAPEGARAENHLSWEFGAPASWTDDTKGGWREGLMERVKKDAEEYRVAKGLPESFRQLAKRQGETST